MNTASTPVALPSNAPFVAEVLEKKAVDDLARAREDIIEHATQMRNRMTRLLKGLEDPEEQPPHASGAAQMGAELEQRLTKFWEKRETLHTIRLLRRATEAPKPVA